MLDTLSQRQKSSGYNATEDEIRPVRSLPSLENKIGLKNTTLYHFRNTLSLKDTVLIEPEM